MKKTVLMGARFPCTSLCRAAARSSGLLVPGGAPRTAPVSVTTTVLCQERELRLWDSGAFDVFCSQIMRVLQLPNANIGFPVWLGGYSGGSWFPRKATYCRKGSDCDAPKCVLGLKVTFSNRLLRWTPVGVQIWWKWSLQILASCYRCKTTECSHCWSGGRNQWVHNKASSSWEEGEILVKATRWHTDVWHFF